MAKTLRIFSLILLLPIVTGCIAAQNARIRITVTNPLPEARPHETIVLGLNEITALAPSLDPAAIDVLDQAANTVLTCQLIDTNQDGMNDQLVFQSDFKPNESKQFLLGGDLGKRNAAPPITDARFMRPREDVAWENDRIAFRIYGPALAKDVNNGIDVWCKRVRYPIVEKWYKGDEDTGSKRVSYHEDHGEGADFFDVGRSLGAGGDALVNADSLIQPGVFSTYKVIANGPIRAMFETTYPAVRYDGAIVTETRRITLDAGSNLNKVEVFYRSDKSGPPDKVISFVAGLVKRKNIAVSSDRVNGWAALWGQTNANGENGSLGTGIVMPKGTITGITEDKVHVLVRGKANFMTPATYYAGACWTRSGDILSSDEWNAYLKDFARRLASPLKIALQSVR